jgi:hypothetical protein
MCNLGNDRALRVLQSACCETFHKPSLNNLDLSFNNILRKGAESIGKFLRFQCPSRNIESLVMKFNPIEAKGVLSIMRANVVKYLDCRYTIHTEIDAAARSLIQGLFEDHVLRVLMLDGNGLSVSGALLEASNRKKDMQLSIGEGAPLPHIAAVVKEKASSQNYIAVPFTERAFQEVRQIEGEFTIVRGRLRDVQPHHISRPRSLSQRSICLEVCNQPLGSEQTQSVRSSAPRSRSFSCDPAPGIGRVAEKLKAQHEFMRSSSQTFSPPAAVTKPVARWNVSGLSPHHKPEAASADDTSAKTEISKGHRAKLLLKKCLACDEQCLRILNIDDASLLDRDIIFPREPAELQNASGVPSELNKMEFGSEARLLGVAKILWLILHLPGERVSTQIAASMTDIPPSISPCSIERVAKYRCLISVEINWARRFLTQLRENESGKNSKRSFNCVNPRYLDYQEQQCRSL